MPGQKNIWAALQAMWVPQPTGRDVSQIARRIVNNRSFQSQLGAGVDSDVSFIKVDASNTTILDNPNGTLALSFGTLALATPTAPIVLVFGAAGSTTYAYKLVATDGTDTVLGVTAASAATTITNGNATLSATNYNQIGVAAADILTVTGATHPVAAGNVIYNVYRTTGGATQGKIGTITVTQNGGLFTTTTLNDTGLAGDSSTAPTVNTTGSATFAGPVSFANGGSSGNTTLSVGGAVTLAQLNAGQVIVPAVAGVQIRPVNFWMQMNGTFLTSTDIRLSDTTPTTDIFTIPIASAITGANFGPSGAGFVNNATTAHASTTGAGMGAQLGVGLGVQMRQTGTAATGGTSVLYSFSYITS
jgi:hypothetical protein